MNASDYYELIKEEREEWRAAMPDQCMYCGTLEVNAWPGLDVHEIERKSQAPNNWGELCNYLKICRRCHDGPFRDMDHDKQLAVKLIKDPENFDLWEWLRLRDPKLTAPDRVTLDDVVRHLRMVD